MRSASRKPISAWNFRSENHQKTAPTIMVVAVKMMALPVVAVAQSTASSSVTALVDEVDHATEVVDAVVDAHAAPAAATGSEFTFRSMCRDT